MGSAGGAEVSLPEPYWQSPDGAHVLYCGDCLDLLPSLEPGSVDAVVTDPPYDTRAGYPEWCAAWFAELERVSPSIFISCGIVNVAMWMEIKPCKWQVAWLKPAAMGRSPFGFCNWEPMLLWGKCRSDTVDVFTACIIPDDALEGHPCPKPVRWGIQSVSRVSNAGDTILDPFAGSGTTAVACVRTEKEEKYCLIAKRRLEEAIGVGTLFPPTVDEPDLFANLPDS